MVPNHGRHHATVSNYFSGVASNSITLNRTTMLWVSTLDPQAFCLLGICFKTIRPQSLRTFHSGLQFQAISYFYLQLSGHVAFLGRLWGFWQLKQTQYQNKKNDTDCMLPS